MRKVFLTILNVILFVTIAWGQDTLTVKQGDQVLIEAEQVTTLMDSVSTPIPNGNIVFYNLMGQYQAGQTEMYVTKQALDFSIDNISTILINTGINDVVGTHKIIGWTTRWVPDNPTGNQEVDQRTLGIQTELILIVEQNIDDTPTQKWVIRFKLL